MLRALPVALAVLVACGGCHHDAPPPVPESGGAPATSGEAIVRLEDDGKTIDVASGARIVFKLANSSGTGYAWVAAPVDGAVLAPQGEGEVERTSSLPGGAKLDVLRFIAQGPGTVTVEMSLKRPWEDAGAAKTLKVTVNVR